MKTRKQVLAEFQRMQNQLCDKVRGFVVVQEHNGYDFAYWCIKIQVTTFKGLEIEARDEVEWTHYSCQGEENERENEAVLAEFKEKFNLK